MNKFLDRVLYLLILWGVVIVFFVPVALFLMGRI